MGKLLPLLYLQTHLKKKKKKISLTIDKHMFYPHSSNTSVKQSWPQSYGISAYTYLMYLMYVSTKIMSSTHTCDESLYSKQHHAVTFVGILWWVVFSGFAYPTKWYNNHTALLLSSNFQICTLGSMNFRGGNYFLVQEFQYYCKLT
jgi:hypothetical protein